MPSLGKTGVHITDTATLGLATWNRATQAALTTEMKQACVGLRNRMNSRLRWRSAPGAPGGRATGQLARSIAWGVESDPNRIEGIVAAGVPYAKYVEGWNSRGQHVPIKRHFVSFKTAPGLLKWAERHGIQNLYRSSKTGRWLKRRGKYGRLASGGMLVGGPNFPSPFMEPTLKEQEPQIAARFGRVMSRMTRG